MIIMISGKAESGKTTFAELLVEKFKENNEKALIINFADYLKFLCKQYLNWNGEKDEAGRRLLQIEGTDYVRARDIDFWTKSAYNFINLYEERFDHFLIADTRFKSEVEFFKSHKMNPVLIRLYRPGHENSLTQESREHASEIDLDGYEYDKYFEARDIKELKDAVDIFYKSTKTQKEIPEEIYQENKGNISDGHHTFDELYYHRMVLFSIICNQNKEKAWKSKLHHDGSMYENYFVVGLNTSRGQYSYHYHMDNWDHFNVKELELAPEWDGHKPEDITRLFTLL